MAQSKSKIRYFSEGEREDKVRSCTDEESNAITVIWSNFMSGCWARMLVMSRNTFIVCRYDPTNRSFPSKFRPVNAGFRRKKGLGKFWIDEFCGLVYNSTICAVMLNHFIF